MVGMMWHSKKIKNYLMYFFQMWHSNVAGIMWHYNVVDIWVIIHSEEARRSKCIARKNMGLIGQSQKKKNSKIMQKYMSDIYIISNLEIEIFF